MSTFPERGLQAYYPCDTLPEIPDNAAGTTYVQDAWATTDSWTINTGSLSVSGGRLVGTLASSAQIIMSRVVSFSGAKTYRIKMRSSVSTTYRFRATIDSVSTIIADQALVAGVDTIIPMYIPAGTSVTLLSIISISTLASGDNASVDFVYVGSGLYDTKLVDDSDNAFDATVYSACPQSGISGNGLYFNGQNAYAIDAMQTPAIHSIAFWCYIPTKSPAVLYCPISHTTVAGNLFPTFDITSTEIRYRWTDGTTRSIAVSRTPYAGTIVHIAGTNNGAMGSLYINGALVGTANYASTLSPGYLQIGRRDDPYYYQGLMDEIRVYSRALSADEIAIMYREIVAKPDYGYLESDHEDIAYTATWDKSFSFTYVAGTTVVIKPTLSEIVPVGSTVKIYAGETIATLTECPPDVETGLVFVSTVSGATNLYVRMVLFTSSRAYNPTVASLNILVKQSTSLYTLATQILSDGLTPANAEWDIDLELQKYLIPYAWMKTKSHRKAIGEVAEAAGGVAYQDRYGVVRVEAGNYLQRETSLLPVSTIGQDRILNLTSPISTVKNRIQVQTWPYTPDTSQTIWELSSAKAINSGEVISFDLTWQDIEAAIDCSAAVTSSPAGATITAETYYSYGAHIEVTGSSNGQSITALTITGKPLVVVGGELITETDGESIRRNGDKTLSIMENKLIQSSALAETIAEAVIATTADEFRDVSIDWRGDPTLELGDKVSVDDIVGLIVTQEFSFNGALKAKAQVRKV